MDYLEIKKSDYYKNTYAEIEELKKDFCVNHGFIHVDHVIDNAKALAKVFKLSKKQTDLLLVASVLHDIGYLKGREHHAHNGSVLAREFLNANGFDEDSINVIADAISKHGGKNVDDYKEKIPLCLILADKIDFIGSRYIGNVDEHPSIRPFLTVNKTYFEKDGSDLTLHIETKDKNVFLDVGNNYFYNKLSAVLDKVKEAQKLNVYISIDQVNSLEKTNE